MPDTDHVAAPFRVGGGWGASAKSNFSGLRYRAPVYRTLRELVMRYFEGYVNLRGDRTLRAYSPPVDLRRFDRTHRDWMATDDELWWIPQYLVRVPHIRLLTPAMLRALRRVDGCSCSAALVGYRAPLRALARGGGSLAQSRNTRTVESSAGKKHSILISWSVTSRGVPSVAMVVNRRSEVSPRRT